MFFTLIVCTYQRPEALTKLLNSVKVQTRYPNEILIIDGSIDQHTQELDLEAQYQNLKYYLIGEENRGLTKQRNYGIEQVAAQSEIICFLDDDTVLDKDYFKHLIATYEVYPQALGVGGYINNEVRWEQSDSKPRKGKYQIDGFQRNEGSRFMLRKRFGLVTNDSPGFMPTYSHGRSVGYLPPSGRIYSVEFFMGGVSSYRAAVFKGGEQLNDNKAIKFSEYFEGYGLYEDLDFCLRLSKIGQLYLNTNAQLGHFHEASGRPNRYKYGKMVIRNGWYVWKVKYPKTDLKSGLKWHATAGLLTVVRASNIFTSSKKKEALTEVLGRISGWFSLWFNAPKINS